MKIKLYPYIIVLIVFSSCKKFVEINAPTTQLVSSVVFTNDATANSAMDGIYSQMMSKTGFASGNITLYCGLSSDEFDNYSKSQAYVELAGNNITVNNSNVAGLWGDAYSYIYDANAILEGLQNSKGVSAAVKQELEGEAKFIRAFCNFYLTNLFGKIPLILGTDYRQNDIIARTSQDSIYTQIISDLKDAQTLLPNDYSLSNGERTRPNKYAATALLARTYLYKAAWPDAEEQATNIINNNTYALVNTLDSVFLKNSKEAIWQLAPVRPNENTREELVLAIVSKPQFESIDTTMLNSFEMGDKRRRQWIDSVLSTNGITYYFPYKYKIYKSGLPVTEYYMMLRLAEQYLIRAEARAEQNKLTGEEGAIEDLNIIRNRAGLPDYSGSIDKTSVLEAILKERRVELFSEWGHRWFDLKRTNTASSVLSNKSGWQPTDVLYPIPQSEIINDPNLSQNEGY